MEAIFDFKDINRRMNRRPLVAVDLAKEPDKTVVSVYNPITDSIKHYNITNFKGKLLSIDRYFEWQN